MMFIDEKDKRRAYLTAKEIAEILDIQLEEIEELDGHFTVDVSYISLDEKARRIDVETEYLNEDDGKRYSLKETVNAHAGTYKFFAKVFYMWLMTFACTYEHGVEFSGNV